MGNNGTNLLAHYYHRFPPRVNWSIIFAGLTIIITLITILWLANEKITDLKLKNNALELRNEIQKQIIEHRYAPSTQPPP